MVIIGPCPICEWRNGTVVITFAFHQYRHNFVDTLVPLCNCGLMESENTTHFLLRCNFYPNLRKTLLDSIIKLIGSMSDHSEAKLINVLLYGDKNYSIDTNSSILQATTVNSRYLELSGDREKSSRYREFEITSSYSA